MAQIFYIGQSFEVEGRSDRKKILILLLADFLSQSKRKHGKYFILLIFSLKVDQDGFGEDLGEDLVNQGIDVSEVHIQILNWLSREGCRVNAAANQPVPNAC